MSANDKVWSLCEKVRNGMPVLKSAEKLLRKKLYSGEKFFVTRYYGYRASGKLSVIGSSGSAGKPGSEKSLTFKRDWRDSEVPVMVEPTFASEARSIKFSPLASDHLDFNKLYEIPESFAERGRLISAVINFFEWAVLELGGKNGGHFGPSANNTFAADVEVERYFVADRIAICGGNGEKVIWVNSNTNQVWELKPSGELSDPASAKRKANLPLFLGCFVGLAAAMWGLALQKNTVSMPPVTLQAMLGFSCAGLALLAGVFLRGWLSKLVALAAVAFGANALVPWIGEAWDMTSDAILATFFVSGDWQGAPIGSVYVACSTVLTLLALAFAPSLAVKVDGSKLKVALSGVLLAAAVSPWPKALESMREVSPLSMRIAVATMVVLCMMLTGQCGWTVSKKVVAGDGFDKLLAKVAKNARPSKVYFYIASVIGLVLIWNQICLMG